MNFLIVAAIIALALMAYAHFVLHVTLAQILTKLEGKASSAVPPVTVNVGSAADAVSSPSVTAPPPAVGSGKLPAGIDTPDANGFVALTGLPAGNYYSKIRFSIGEVGAALSGVQHASVQLNTGFLANGRQITTGLIGVCAQIEAVTDGTTGAQTYRLKQPQVSIPGTIALPPSFTVASATAHFAALPDPNTKGAGGFMPGR